MVKTKIWDVRPDSDDLTHYSYINEIKDTILNGGLIGLPTETVYGLAADARNQQAVENIYRAKGRPSDNPLIVHIHDQRQLTDFVTEVSEQVTQLMNAFWPGPISFILPLKSGYLCEKVTGGLKSIAVRMPSHPVGRQLLQIIDVPLAAPSANLSGRPSPTTFEHVKHDLDGKIDGIVQATQSEVGLESTVLDCTSFPFKIARPGSITASMIENIVPNSIEASDYNDEQQPIAPGMKYKHYSPETPVTIITSLTQAINDNKDWSHSAFIVPRTLKTYIPNTAMYIELCNDENDIITANHNLYRILHDIDDNSNIADAYIYGFKQSENSEAIMNRMIKAAGHRMIEGGQL